MNFFSTSRFKNSIRKLESRENNYSCIRSHIYKQLSGKTDDELFETCYKLNGNHPVARFMKVRILSCGGNAKSEGFRLIVFVNIRENNYYILDVYPKTGPLRKSNMKKDERKICLTELKEEKDANKLYTVTLNSKNETIVLKK